MATLIDPFKGTLIRSFLNQVPTLGYLGFRFDLGEDPASLGRPLGHFIFSRIGLIGPYLRIFFRGFKGPT